MRTVNPASTIRSAAGLLAAVLLAAGSASAAPAREIRLGLVGNPYNKPLATGVLGHAQERGILEEEFAKDGVKVTWTFYKGTGPAINEALANNKVDVASYGDLPGILGRSAGIDTRLIIPGPVSQNIYVAVGPGTEYKSVKDLKGKRVGYHKGTYMHLSFVRLVRSLGLAEKDYKVFNLSIPDGNAALQAGHIDAYVGTNTLVELSERGAVRLLYHTDGVDPQKRALQGFSTVVATGRFLKENPDLVQRFVNAYVRAAAEALRAENREAWIKLAAKPGYLESNIRFDLARSDLAEQNAPVFDERYLSKLRVGIEASREAGLIRADIDVAKWVDASFLEKALKEGRGNYPWSAAPAAEAAAAGATGAGAAGAESALAGGRKP